MCTAVTVTPFDHYFGRNLDYEQNFGEKITVTPRNYIFSFTNGLVLEHHYAMVGVALPYKNYPLYFDGCNEKGLCMAGLYFPQNAVYYEEQRGKQNVASFELIPWVLSQYESLEQAEEGLAAINISNVAFDEKMKPTPLHWLLADKTGSITVEQTKEGLALYRNPVGVLTNNPPFAQQMFHLQHYAGVSSQEPINRFSELISVEPYSKGLGGLGLPGDFSSMSRFVRACFMALNSVFSQEEDKNVHQFFHILNSVYQIKGGVRTKQGYELTHYTCCCNATRGIYYYTTYYNSQVRSVDMRKENLDTDDLMLFTMDEKEGIYCKNCDRTFC